MMQPMHTTGGDPLYPMLFVPVYKDYLWGGSRIAAQYQRRGVPPVCAESWELSAHADGPGVLRNGPLAGSTLADLVSRYGSRLVGTRCRTPGFPLLIKLLDAHAPLSVQVHPNQETAALYGGDPKTEAWVVLQADPNAAVYAGLADGVDAATLARAARGSGMQQCLARHAVREWDAILVPGGLVHAIDAGCMIFEVQQASNTTYRIHDWGRIGPDGRPRDLHLDKAFQVIQWSGVSDVQQAVERVAEGAWGTRDRLCESAYFRVERVDLKGPWRLPRDPGTFQALFVARGSASIEGGGVRERLVHGTSCLIPADVADVDVAPHQGPATLLRVTLP